MKKIKIFIGSSIDDLAYERRDLVSFISELNNKYVDRGIYIEPYICEEKSNEMRPEGSQKVHDDYIENDADAMIFMFFRKAGKYTLRELQIAKESLEKKDKKSYVLIYFKTINNEIVNTEEIKLAVDKIAGEYAHYYKKFSEVDTIKLELLQYLSNVLDENSLTIRNGKVYIGDIEASNMDLSNVFAYQNNAELLALKKELDELEIQLQKSIDEKNWNLLKVLSDKHQKTLEKYTNLELEILYMLQQLFTCLREENVNPIRLKALMLLEEGKHKEALLLLPLNEITTKSNIVIQKKALQDESIKQEAYDIIQDAITRIRALLFNVNDITTDIEIEKTYDSIVDMAIVAGKSKILHEYVGFLEGKGDVDKLLRVARLIEKNFDKFDDIDLFTKYDIYNIFADYSDDEEEKAYYYKIAKDSAYSYIDSIDKKDWEKYLYTCEQLIDTDIFDSGAIVFIEDAIGIVLNHPEISCYKENLYNFYHSLAFIYEESGDKEKVELYLNRSIEISKEETLEFKDINDLISKKNNLKDFGYKISHENDIWQFRLVLNFERLYKINKEKYQIQYINSLILYALMLFVENRYQGFVEYLFKANEISKDIEEYEFLRNFVENKLE